MLKGLDEGKFQFKKKKPPSVVKKLVKGAVKKLPYIGAVVTAGLAVNQLYETIKSEKNRRKKKEVIDSPSGAGSLFENSKTKP
jgi:hypothetical protein